MRGSARQGLFELVAVPRIVKAGSGGAWQGLAWIGEAWQSVTWLANCGSFPQQVNPTVRWGMVGKGSARQGSVYQSGGIANSSRRGGAWQGGARLGKGTSVQWWRLLRIVKVWDGTVRHGKAGRGEERIYFTFNRRL